MSPPRFVISILCLASVALADDFKTLDGKEYKNATVNRVEPDGIVIKTKSGILKVYFAELPQEVQERFHYNAQQAAQFTNQTTNQTIEENRLIQKQKLEEEEKRAQQIEKNREHIRQQQEAEMQQPRLGAEQQRQVSNMQLTYSGSRAHSVFAATVIDIIDQGQAALMSVEPVDPSQGAVNPPRPYSTVYVRGDFSGGVDGTEYKVMGCVEIGTFHYTTAVGGAATVRAFASNHLIRLSPSR